MSTLRSRPCDGFSLVEILIVIAVMGILAAIAMPMYLGSRTRAENASAREAARTIAIAVTTYVLSTEDHPPLPAADCNREFLVAGGAITAEDWPDNVFFPGEPMQQGDREGDFAYEVSGGPRQFKLTLHLRDAPDFTVP